MNWWMVALVTVWFLAGGVKIGFSLLVVLLVVETNAWYEIRHADGGGIVRLGEGRKRVEWRGEKLRGEAERGKA